MNLPLRPFPKQKNDILDKALRTCRKAFYFVILFSMCASFLQLALPIYSMQVLDRVLSSGSMETLAMLSLVVLGAFICYGLLAAARAFVMIRVANWLDRELAPALFRLSIASSAIRNSASGTMNMRDLGTLKSFITGNGMMTLMDTPWSIVFFVMIFIIHPLTGFIALGGGTVLFLMALLNELATKETLDDANETNVKSFSMVEMASRNAEVIEAMGMAKAVVANWFRNSQEVSQLQIQASSRAAIIQSVSKIIRLFLQIFVIGVGAYLTLKHELSSGAIIACSILAGRAMAPFEASIEIWKNFIAARKSHQRLKKNIATVQVRNEAMSLPVPTGRIQVEKVVFAPVGATKPVIKGISFELQPGEIVGVIGPSAAGKSTLAKLMTGVWKPNAGAVRLDDADVYNWNRDDFGNHVGYLPQDVELFNGTIKENIARMDPDADAELVVEAAQLAGVHELILHLPNGYETEIGVGGSSLSAGQRQRVGLARAFFGDPKLVVLDEPNANLDSQGEIALAEALRKAKARKITTIIISHRPSILANVDKVIVMNDGLISNIGPKDEIVAKLMGKAPAAQQVQAVN